MRFSAFSTKKPRPQRGSFKGEGLFFCFAGEKKLGSFRGKDGEGAEREEGIFRGQDSF